MYILRLGLACVLLASIGPMYIAAQATGSLDVQGKALKIDGKSNAVSRKRFYLFKGGLKDNQDLRSPALRTCRDQVARLFLHPDEGQPAIHLLAYRPNQYLLNHRFAG